MSSSHTHGVEEDHPHILPKKHIVDGLPLPGVGRFPMVEAERKDWPLLDNKAWRTLAFAINEKDRGNGGGGSDIE